MVSYLDDDVEVNEMMAKMRERVMGDMRAAVHYSFANDPEKMKLLANPGGPGWHKNNRRDPMGPGLGPSLLVVDDNGVEWEWYGPPALEYPPGPPAASVPADTGGAQSRHAAGEPIQAKKEDAVAEPSARSRAQKSAAASAGTRVQDPRPSQAAQDPLKERPPNRLGNSTPTSTLAHSYKMDGPSPAKRTAGSAQSQERKSSRHVTSAGPAQPRGVKQPGTSRAVRSGGPQQRSAWR